MNALRMFAGPMAKTADHQALARAQEMAGQGATRDAIWRDTGWFQGVDGKWRFEIDDSQSGLRPIANQELTSGGDYGATQRRIAGVLDHSQLFDAYPSLRQADADVRYNRELGGSTGSWDSQAEGVGGRPQLRADVNSIGGPQGARGIILHETQHGIQEAENFARGGNLEFHYPEEMIQRLDDLKYQADELIPQRWNAPTQEAKDAIAAQEAAIANEIADLRAQIAQSRFDHYRRLGGETEARNVQSRMSMTADERRSRAPWETQDVPDDQQIVRFDGDRASNALGDILRASAGLGGVALAGDITLRELLREQRARRTNPAT
jgi:hypothetical protein